MKLCVSLELEIGEIVDELDRLLTEFSSRKNSEKTRQENESERLRTYADNSRRIIESILLPIAKQISDRLKSDGHESSVKEAFRQGVLNPSLSMTLRAKTAERVFNYDAPTTSEILFIHDDLGSLNVICKVFGLKRQSSPEKFEERDSWKLSEISEQRVRDKLIGFVGSVLRAN